MKIKKEHVIAASYVLILVACSILLTFLITKKIIIEKVGIVCETTFSVKEKPVVIEDFVNPYSFFLDDEKAQYICSLCEDFKVDSDLVVAILMKENPTLVEDAVSKMNLNGTVDLGLFQLNDRSIYSKGGFLEMFWSKDFPEFNPSNWKHNSYIAVRFIRDLLDTFGENAYEKVIASYNCGVGNVYRETIPDITKNNYVPGVLNNLKLIRNS